jgi:hypothetical protein
MLQPPVILGIENPGDSQLFFVIGALNPAGPVFGLRHRREEQCRQDGEDRNHHQQLDEGERNAPIHRKCSATSWHTRRGFPPKV